jgi:mannose/cellobiose epimerase-like protein (N-acyl-D-glucosamine 2-epimerase family)
LPVGIAVPAWLRGEPDRLLGFARRSALPGSGFGWLDDRGRPVPGRPLEAWISCRMTHVFALGCLAGRPELRPYVDHGVAALDGLFRDTVHGGWFTAVADGRPVVAQKRAYDHAFVLLAAASATAAGATGAEHLLDDACTVVERWFWDEDAGLCFDALDRSWERLADYRGVNANMHMVEAFLATADVTGDRTWLDRAVRITDRVVHGFAREHGWRLPEHYDAAWRVLLEHNRDEPDHPFRPYGVTIGHLLEWSRLCLCVENALGDDAPDWLRAHARDLFATAVRDGWAVDGADGFVYTVDFDGTPVVRQRFHWVLAEAIAAACTLAEATGEAAYATWFEAWCAYAERYLVDPADGSWRHELGSGNRPASTVWAGKPDVYHAFQAALLPRLGVISSFAGALGA